jgi:hypothetical protein
MTLQTMALRAVAGLPDVAHAHGLEDFGQQHPHVVVVVDEKDFQQVVAQGR